MCFLKKLEDHELAKITKDQSVESLFSTAEQDIQCYKQMVRLGFNHFESPIQGFKYRCGALYKQPLPVLDDISFYNKRRVILIGKGVFHSYITGSDNLVRCVIPKGARYIVSVVNNEYISSEIIINKDLRTRWQRFTEWLGF